MSENENKTAANIAGGFKGLLAALLQNKAVLAIVAVVIVLLFVLGIGVGSCSAKGSKPKANAEVANSAEGTSENGGSNGNNGEASQNQEIAAAENAFAAGFYSIVTGEKIEKTAAASAPTANPISEFRYKVLDAKPGLFVQYVGTSNNVVFPQEIQGIPVLEVGMRNSAGEKNIIIPEGVEAITSMGSVAIVKIDIPTTLKVIRNEAFLGCKINGDFAIPSTCKLGDYVFQRASIAKVVWPFVTVPEGTFYQSPTLASIKFSDSTKVVGNAAARECPALTSVAFPENLSKMGTSAFRGNAKLVSVTGLKKCSKFETNDTDWGDASGNLSTTEARRICDAGRQFFGCNALDVVTQNNIRAAGYTDVFAWKTGN